MPTPTDLVTDLPADFEVFGQAVDTSMADLKGGTTGQILSKATNTDMDFTWITNDVGDITNIAVTSPITGGGSSGSVTIGVNAATTSASGAVQLSDSTSTTSSVLASTPTATKAAYDLAASAYAPAFTNNFYAGKNKIINGNFAINQRAFTSTACTGALAVYGFDRWRGTGQDGTVTYSAQTFTPGAAPVTGYEAANFARIVTTGQVATNSLGLIGQPIEDVRTFANQTIAVSFWAKAATGTPKIAVELDQQFGTGGSTRVTTYAGQITLSTSWARYSVSVAVPSISGKTIGTGSSLVVNLFASAGSDFNSRTGSLGIQTGTFDFWGVQVEAASTGSTASPFQTASGSIAGELALCQRYYWRQTGNYTQGFGVSTASTTAQIAVKHPVTMRVAPTSIDFSTLGIGDRTNYTLTVSAVAFYTAGVDYAELTVTNGAGATTNRPAFLGSTSGSGYIGFTAEL